MHIGVVCADRKSGGCPAASDTFESGTALRGDMATSTGDRSAKVSLEHHVSGDRRACGEGAYRACASEYEDQGDCTAGA